MQAYYEIETNIPHNHQLHITLPEMIPAGRAKIAVIYESSEIKKTVTSPLKNFLNKYRSEDIDIDTRIFDHDRKLNKDRDFQL